MKAKTHLTYKQLVQMETLLEGNISIPQIAIRIWKNKTTIYRCIWQNSDDDWIFRSDSAWQKIQDRQFTSTSHPRIVSDSILEAFILEKIKISWSPEQVAGRWKMEQSEPLSNDTIYSFIRKNHPSIAEMYFRRKEKHYHNRKQEKIDWKYQLKERRMIDERPKEIEERKVFWHWEWDTVIWKDHKWAIVTNVERKSWFLLAGLVPTKTAENILNTTEELFADIPERFRLTITYDNWREFALHKKIEELLWITVYFAHIYSSYERWTNENTNGLLREYIPKWTDFSTVTKEDLEHYLRLINNRPRKRLWFKTPYEVIEEEMKSCIWL